MKNTISKQALVNQIYQLEKEHDGFLLHGYEEHEEFIKDLMEVSDFKELLMYYDSIAISTGNEDIRSLTDKTIKSIQTYLSQEYMG